MKDKKEIEGRNEEEQKEWREWGEDRGNGQYILCLIKNYPLSDYFNLEF